MSREKGCLEIGDRVQSESGASGELVAFEEDTFGARWAMVRWDGSEEAERHSVEYLDFESE